MNNPSFKNYHQTYEEVKSLFIKNQFTSAIDIIKQILKDTNLSDELREKFAKLYDDINYKIYTQNEFDPSVAIPLCDSLKLALKNKKIDNEELLHLCKNSDFVAVKYIVEDIKEFLMDNSKNNECKTWLLRSLWLANYDEEISVCKHNKIYTLNPQKSFNIYNKNGILEETWRLLSKFFWENTFLQSGKFDDVQNNWELYAHSRILIHSFYFATFPQLPPAEDIPSAVAAVILYVAEQLNLEKYFSIKKLCIFFAIEEAKILTYLKLIESAYFS